jgi:hypothetical protein
MRELNWLERFSVNTNDGVTISYEKWLQSQDSRALFASFAVFRFIGKMVRIGKRYCRADGKEE